MRYEKAIGDVMPAQLYPLCTLHLATMQGEFTVMRQWLVALFVMELAAHGQADLFGITPSWFAALVALLSLPSIIVGGTMGQWLGGERAMIVIMLMRPRGLWPSPEHGKAAPQAVK